MVSRNFSHFYIFGGIWPFYLFHGYFGHFNGSEVILVISVILGVF